MKKSVLLITLLIVCINLTSQQGVRFDKEKYNNTESWEEDELGFSNVIPVSHSMRKYCPPIANQGNTGTCVGWATAYGVMSITHNIIHNITEPDKKLLFSFDPYFIYSTIKNYYDYDCSEGTIMINAMEMLVRYGCKRTMIYNKSECNTVLNDTLLRYSNPFKIKEFFKPPPSFETDNVENKAITLKKVLSGNNPLLIGANVTSTMGTQTINANGLWDSFSNEDIFGGHAMCLIGYDDDKFGGAFEVMNSWGDDFGDNGFIWIKYNDFFRLVDEIYMLKTYKENNTTNDCIIGDCEDLYGNMKYADGNQYEGDFRKGKKGGFGLLNISNGDQSIGYWKNGKKDGVHLFYNASSKSWSERTYRNGKVTDRSELGFVNTLTEEDKAIQSLMNTYEENGLIKIVEEEFED